MPWYKLILANRHHPLTSPNAVPLFILFVLLTLLIILAEQDLLTHAIQAEQITIHVDAGSENAVNDDGDEPVPLADAESSDLLSPRLPSDESFSDWLSKNYQINEKSALKTPLALKPEHPLYKAADKMYGQKQYAQTVRLLNLVTLHARIASGKQFIYAASLSRSEQSERAEKAYRELLDLQKNNQPAWLNLGFLLKRQGKYQQALEAFSKAEVIAGGRRRAKALLGKAECLTMLNAFEAADVAYQSAIELRPSHAYSWLRYAHGLIKAGADDSKIRSIFENAIVLKKNKQDYRLDYVSYLLKELDFDTAIGVLRQAEKQKSRSFIVREMLAWSYLMIDKKRSAGRQIKWLKKHNKDNAMLARYALLSALRSEDTTAIKKALDQFHDEDEYALIYRYLANHSMHSRSKEKTVALSADKLLKSIQYWVSLKDLAESESVTDSEYQAFAGKYVNSSQVYYQLARTSLNRKDLSQAGLMLDHALSLNPDRTRLYLMKVDVMRSQHDFEDALALLNKAVVAKPRSIHLQMERANMLFSLHRYQDAAEAYQKVVEEDGDNTEAMFNLAVSYKQKRQQEKAITVLEQLLLIDNSHVKARYELAESFCQLGNKTECLKQSNLVLRLDSHHSQAQQLIKKYS